MKKIVNILIMAIAGTAMLCACNAPDRELITGYEAKFIDVTEVVCDYDAFPGTSRLIYDCTETVTASSNRAWLSVKKIADGEMELEVKANGTIVTRDAVVTLKAAGGESVKVPVTQRGIVLKTSVSGVRLPSEGGEATVEISSPVAFNVSTTADWLVGNYTVEGNVVTINLPALTGVPRLATVDVELPEQKLRTSFTVEQLGNLVGFGLAGKFIGTEGVETAWYFDPNADNGPAFNSSWIYTQFGYLKIGRINVTEDLTNGSAHPVAHNGMYQCLRYHYKWSATQNYYTGYQVDITEGESDDRIVFAIDFVNGATGSNYFWLNDRYFFSIGAVSAVVTNITGFSADAGAANKKTYYVINANDLENPTVMTLRDSGNSNNWFTVTKTPVTL